MTSFHGITQAQYNAVMNPLIAHESGYFNGWFILPILAGLTSWFQMKMTMPPQQPQAAAGSNSSQPANPMGGKTMQYIFPLISVYFTASSNSVFALYWITSNIVSIATYKGVDMVWKMNARKKEQEELAAQEEAERTRAALIAKTAQGKLQAPAANKASGSSGNQSKTNPKEGKNK
jgi:membrane protein insertase Oxa1/YidC/SpoIIIJ